MPDVATSGRTVLGIEHGYETKDYYASSTCSWRNSTLFLALGAQQKWCMHRMMRLVQFIQLCALVIAINSSGITCVRSLLILQGIFRGMCARGWDIMQPRNFLVLPCGLGSSTNS